MFIYMILIKPFTILAGHLNALSTLNSVVVGHLILLILSMVYFLSMYQSKLYFNIFLAALLSLLKRLYFIPNRITRSLSCATPYSKEFTSLSTSTYPFLEKALFILLYSSLCFFVLHKPLTFSKTKKSGSYKRIARL